MADHVEFYGKMYKSRFLLGTALYPSPALMKDLSSDQGLKSSQYLCAVKMHLVQMGRPFVKF